MSSKQDSCRQKKGSKQEIMMLAKAVLAERTKRCTYITLKRTILEQFTENSFQRHKGAVQTLLEEFHKRLTPARPKKRSQALSPRTDGRPDVAGGTEAVEDSSTFGGFGGCGGGGSSSGGSSSGGSGATKTDAAAAATHADSRKKKSPKLYFYEMSEDDDKAAEGNRFIGNNDL
jgi:hypothetical protein